VCVCTGLCAGSQTPYKMPVDFVLNGDTKKFALKHLRELKGEHVYLVNKNTASPLKMKNNGDLKAEGGLGKNAQWKVKKMGRKIEGCAVVGFKNIGNKDIKKCWLAIKDGEMSTGSGGEHCEFIVVPNGKAVKLVKAKNTDRACGMTKGGDFKPAAKVGDGDAGKWFIFNTSDVE